jgi:hypothetical protein
VELGELTGEGINLEVGEGVMLRIGLGGGEFELLLLDCSIAGRESLTCRSFGDIAEDVAGDTK